MMSSRARWISWPWIAVAACAEPTMPPAIERARDVLAVAWSEGTTYWIQSERGVGGALEALHRSAGDQDEVIDRGAPRVSEPGTFYIVPGTDGVAWGHIGTREACGRVRIATRDGGRAVDGDELPCQFRVVAQRAGRLLVAPVGGRGMSSFDAATGRYAQLPGVDAGGEVERFAQHGDVVYALVTEIGGQYLGRFAAVDPSAVAPLAYGIRSGLGPVLDDDGAVWWLDNQLDGVPRPDPRRVYRLSGVIPSPIAKLDEPAHGVAWAGGALWVRQADQVVRIAPGDPVTNYTIDEPAGQWIGAGDRLLSLVPDVPGSPPRLVEQPLP
ncbi:MAG: hypothetical protein ACTHU0_13400 [Kofleriaceae bacterium]